jgi:hypothetical protein
MVACAAVLLLRPYVICELLALEVFFAFAFGVVVLIGGTIYLLGRS